MKGPIRVLIADDSATMRTALAELLREEKRISVVGQARDGLEAVELARTLKPDVITMDVNMPLLDGLQATATIMAESPARILVVCSVAEEKQLDLSFRAIAAGALELLPKPSSARELRRWGALIAESVLLMAEVPVVRRTRKHAALKPNGTRRTAGTAISALGIVASTGGPPAIALVLQSLPKTLPVPILIAQHIAAGFGPGLLRWFSAVSQLPVGIAEDGQRAKEGCVYLAPDGCDLELDAHGALRVPRGASLHTPSGNRLLQSLARGLGTRAGGVVLTGMGDDGALGLLAIRKAGGATLVQDEATSVVFGMPHAAHALGAAQSLVPLEWIALSIVELCRETGTP